MVSTPQRRAVAAGRISAAIARAAHPLTGAPEDFAPLMDMIGDARIVLLGEASHGTHEFYAERARITRRLVLEKGFHAVAVEGDWPECRRVTRYLEGAAPEDDAIDSLAEFRRFPAWMWRNADVLDFVGWLRAHNERSPGAGVGFYGLDLYSLHSSASAVLDYLESNDPDGAERARRRYACLEMGGGDPQAYGFAARYGLTQDCDRRVLEQLVDFRRRRMEYLSRDGRAAEDDYFFAEQNARVVKNAESYYRTMFAGRVQSWNLRDRHMAETLSAIVDHLDRRVGRSKVVVWAHNSHVGDARATWMGRSGELNIGQLVRERWGGDSVAVGFTTSSGTVTAASDWGAPAERKRVRTPLPGSYEELFHRSGRPRFLLPLHELPGDLGGLLDERIERAIGVIYRPDTERQSHYFDCCLPRQFDAILHFDETRAVEPLERSAEWERGEAPETYPSGL